MISLAERLKRLQRSIVALEVARQEGGGSTPPPEQLSTVKHYQLSGKETYQITHNQDTEILVLNAKTAGRDGVPLMCSHRIIDGDSLEIHAGTEEPIEVIITFHRLQE